MSELETKVLQAAQSSVAEAIKSTFSGYNNPLKEMCSSVVEKHSDKLKEIFENSIVSVLESGDFKSSVNEAMNHKLARALVAKMEGSIDKAVTTLRSDPTLRAKMVLAIENIINDANNQ